MFSHLLRDSTKSYTREVIDGKPRIFRVVQREHITTTTFHLGILESLHDCFETHSPLQFLQQQLDKDAAATRGIFLVHLYRLEYGP